MEAERQRWIRESLTHQARARDEALLAAQAGEQAPAALGSEVRAYLIETWQQTAAHFANPADVRTRMSSSNERRESMPKKRVSRRALRWSDLLGQAVQAQQAKDWERVERLLGQLQSAALSQITENRKVEARKSLIFQHTIFTFSPKKATLRQNPSMRRSSRRRVGGASSVSSTGWCSARSKPSSRCYQRVVGRSTQRSLKCDPLVERGLRSSGRPYSQKLCNSVSMRVQVPPSRCRSDSISPRPATGPQRFEAGIHGGPWKPHSGYPVSQASTGSASKGVSLNL
jgi:hypothetical protein